MLWGEIYNHIAKKTKTNAQIISAITEYCTAGRDINAIPEGEMNLLHISCLAGNLAVATHLISIGANPHLPMEDGSTPLHLACEGGHLAVVLYLMENYEPSEVTFNKSGYNPAHFSIKHNKSLEVVRHFAEYFPEYLNIPTRMSSTIDLALSLGTLEMVKYLVAQCELDTNALDGDGKNYLHIASMSSRIEIVKYCVEELGISPSARMKDGCTPIFLAAEKDSLDIVRYLQGREDTKDIRDNKGMLPIHVASERGNLSVLKYFTEECGIDVNIFGAEDFTPLLLATRSGKPSIAEYLIKAGSHIMQSFCYAIMHNRTEMVHLMLQNARVDFKHLTHVSFNKDGREVSHKEIIDSIVAVIKSAEYISASNLVRLNDFLQTPAAIKLGIKLPKDFMNQTYPKVTADDVVAMLHIMVLVSQNIGEDGYKYVGVLSRALLGSDLDLRGINPDVMTYLHIAKAVESIDPKCKVDPQVLKLRMDNLAEGFGCEYDTKNTKFIVNIIKQIPRDLLSGQMLSFLEAYDSIPALQARLTEAVNFSFDPLHQYLASKHKKDEAPDLKVLEALCSEVVEIRLVGINFNIREFTKKIESLKKAIQRNKSSLKFDDYGLFPDSCSSDEATESSSPVKFNGELSLENLKQLAELYKRNPENDFCKSVLVKVGSCNFSPKAKEKYILKLEKVIAANRYDPVIDYDTARAIMKIRHIIPDGVLMKYLQDSTDSQLVRVQKALDDCDDGNTYITRGTRLSSLFFGFDEEGCVDVADPRDFDGFEEGDEEVDEEVRIELTSGSKKLLNWIMTKPFHDLGELKLGDVRTLLTEVGYEVEETTLGYIFYASDGGVICTSHRSHEAVQKVHPSTIQKLKKQFIADGIAEGCGIVSAEDELYEGHGSADDTDALGLMGHCASGGAGGPSLHGYELE